jgi:hypothetical protein
MHLNPNFNGIEVPILKVHLKNELNLDRVLSDRISLKWKYIKDAFLEQGMHLRSKLSD